MSLRGLSFTSCLPWSRGERQRSKMNHFMMRKNDWKETLREQCRPAQGEIRSDISLILEASSVHSVDGMKDLSDTFSSFAKQFPALSTMRSIQLNLKYIDVGGAEGIYALTGALEYVTSLTLFSCDLRDSSSFKALAEVLSSEKCAVSNLCIQSPHLGGLPAYVFHRKSVFCDACMLHVLGPGFHVYPTMDLCARCYSPGEVPSRRVLDVLRERRVNDTEQYLASGQTFPSAEERTGVLGPGAQGSKALFECLSNPHCKLEVLDLQSCDLGGPQGIHGLEVGLSGPARIRMLSFHRCILGGAEGMIALGKAFAACQDARVYPELEFFFSGESLHGKDAVREFARGIALSNLTKLRLDDFSINKEEMIEMARQLQDSTTLHQLTLNSVNLHGGDAAVPLANSIQNWKTLRSLILRHCTIGDAGAEAILQALRRWPPLERIILSRDPSVPQKLKREIAWNFALRKADWTGMIISVLAAHQIRRVGLNSPLKVFPKELCRKLAMFLPIEFKETYDLERGRWIPRQYASLPANFPPFIQPGFQNLLNFLHAQNDAAEMGMDPIEHLLNILPVPFGNAGAQGHEEGEPGDDFV